MNKLEQSQFVLLVRTPNFLDSRSPFIDVSAVAHQREVRKFKQQRQKERDRILREQKNQEKQHAASAASQKDHHQHHHHNQPHVHHQRNAAAAAASSSSSTSAPAVIFEDDEEEEEDADGRPFRKKTMQELLSPQALFGSACIVTGVSRVCEHLLKLYENEVMSERSRKAVAAKERLRQQREQEEAQRKKQQQKEEEQRKRREELAERAAKQLQLAQEQQQQQHSSVDGSGGTPQQQISPAVSQILPVSVSPETKKSAEATSPAATADDKNKEKQQQQQQQHEEQKGGKGEEERSAAKEADQDDQFLDEVDDLSTAYPLSGIPPHFQYDGGIFFKFLDSLPLCTVMELEQDNKSGASEEPRYVPHGMAWIKAQLVLYFEARAKTIEAPKTEDG